jgi:hypothetical protein
VRLGHGRSTVVGRNSKTLTPPDAAWEMLYQTMAWCPGMRLRLRAFLTDPYESTTKYLYPASCQV